MNEDYVDGVNAVATDHWPMFLVSPGETDVLLVVMAVFLVAAVIGVGVFYFKLHSLPEQMAHRGQKVQFEVVAVLGLLSLFTHNHLFWIAGLLLAFVPMPDFSTPLKSMAQSLGKMANPRGETPDPLAPMATPVPPGAETVPAATGPASHDAQGPKSVSGG